MPVLAGSCFGYYDHFLAWFEYHFKVIDRIRGKVKQHDCSWDEALTGLHAEWDEHDRLNRELESFKAPPVNASGTKSIAFMFLTVAPWNQEDLWVEWFSKAPAEEYDILVHNDKGGDIGKLATLARAVKATKTGWATSGLVRATIHLLREALMRPSNTHFVLLSNADIPLYSFADLHKRITSSSLSRFTQMTLNWDNSLGRNIWQGPDGKDWHGCTRAGCSNKADQWAMWNRDDAAWFAENNFLQYLKPRTLFVDEPYCIQLMYQYGRRFENKGVMYTQWKFAADSPTTFTESVPDEVIEEGRSADCWFLRKVSPDAILTAKYKTDVLALSGPSGQH